MLALVEGRAKVEVATPTGRSILLAVKVPGELVGEYAALDGRPRSATVTALEDVDVARVPPDEFLGYLEEHPRLAVALLRTLAHQLRSASQLSIDRDGSEVSVRVARRLVDLAQRFGELNGSSLTISLALTQDDLAAWVGATREATNRALARLRSGGSVTTGRQRIVIADLDALRAAAF